MRIRGSGSGFGFFGFGSGGSRSDSFKKGRKPGQKVRGKLLKWVSENMAWVEIEGHRLLAQLNSRHPVGTYLTFVIKQLHPEVVLKEIFDVASTGPSALSLASNFETARTLFENTFRPYAKRITAVPANEKLKAFISLLSQDKSLLNTFLDAVSCLQTINSAAEGIGTLSYTPWMLPTARRHISLTRLKARAEDSPLIESIMEFDLQSLGMVRFELLSKQQEIGYRLKLQHANKAEELKRYLQSRAHSELICQAVCLGISKLPPSAHGGILAEIMFKKQ